jgi:hypothetical protein
MVGGDPLGYGERTLHLVEATDESEVRARFGAIRGHRWVPGSAMNTSRAARRMR